MVFSLQHHNHPNWPCDSWLLKTIDILPESTYATKVVDPSMDGETIKVPITCLKRLAIQLLHFFFRGAEKLVAGADHTNILP